MSRTEWIVAFTIIGVLLVCSLVYVGYMVYRTQAIRKKNREKKSADLGTSFGETAPATEKKSGSPKPKRLEATLKMPRSPYSGEETGTRLFSNVQIHFHKHTTQSETLRGGEEREEGS